jgi:hypothetical protein
MMYFYRTKNVDKLKEYNSAISTGYLAKLGHVIDESKIPKSNDWVEAYIVYTLMMKGDDTLIFRFL